MLLFHLELGYDFLNNFKYINLNTFKDICLHKDKKKSKDKYGINESADVGGSGQNHTMGIQYLRIASHCSRGHIWAVQLDDKLEETGMV